MAIVSQRLKRPTWTASSSPPSKPQSSSFGSGISAVRSARVKLVKQPVAEPRRCRAPPPAARLEALQHGGQGELARERPQDDAEDEHQERILDERDAEPRVGADYRESAEPRKRAIISHLLQAHHGDVGEPALYE